MTKVRVDFFKPNGKWYTTEEMEWTGTAKDVHHSFAQSLHTHLFSGISVRLDDMVAVCLNPSHEFNFPVMMPVDRIFYYLQVDDSNTTSDEHYEGFDAFKPFSQHQA
jgi:hypothetical protein